MTRMYSPSPTVHDSPVPLYLQGVTNPTDAHHALMSQGFTVDEADLIYSASVSGLISRAEWQSILEGQVPRHAIAHEIFSRADNPGLHGLGDLGDNFSTDPSMFDPGNTLTPPPEFIFHQTDVPFYQPPPSPIDTSMFDPGNTLTPPTFAPIQQPLQLQPSSLFPSLIAAGVQTAGQIVNASRGGVNLSPGPSPRVATRPPGTAAAPGASVFTEQIISGVPNWVLMAGAAAALLAMGKR